MGGFYWGTKVIKPWPPLTWNNCVGGIFMFFFGLVVLYICMKGDDPNAVMLQKYFRFLDTFIGRGCFFMFIGLRIIPLGQFYCLVAGMVTWAALPTMPLRLASKHQAQHRSVIDRTWLQS